MQTLRENAPDTATLSAITITDLRKSYGDVAAVNGVDLTIAPGEVVALLGPNGAGKSTTIDMILGLSTPSTGSITLFGRPPAKAVRDGVVGAVLQEGGLLDDVTVRELVTMVASLYRDPLPVDEAMRRAGVTEIADRKGLLSGGQRQRVRLAVAMVSNPDLLLLDEPTVAMDIESRQAFWASMRQFTDQGRTVVFATHYLAEAEDYADRVVLMQAGRVIADGTVAEIQSHAAGRKLSAAVPGATLAGLTALPGVKSATLRGEQAELHCDDSDAAVQALFRAYPDAKDVEIGSISLEEAFLTLTGARQEGDR